MKWFGPWSDDLPASDRFAFKDLFSSSAPAYFFFLDFVVYPLLAMLCLYLALAGLGSRASLQYLALSAVGYGLWTLAEYVVHRFVLHHVPLVRPMHMAHHEAPRDLIGTPTIFSVLLFFVAVFLPLNALLGLRAASALSVGLLIGYFSYVLVHYGLHHWGSGGFRHLQKLKRHHALHHHLEDQCNYGVTTTIWDRLFGTLK